MSLVVSLSNHEPRARPSTGSGRAYLRLALAAFVSTTACAPRLMTLPSGPRETASDVREALAEATAGCRGVTTVSAEMAVSGSVGGRRVRGRMLAGLAAPASARLEAVAPFGPPLFIFVARGADATLLLPRDDRVLEHGQPRAVLEAVAGVPLDAADLRKALTGCSEAPDAETGRRIGEDWRVVTDGPTEIYLHREQRGGPWRLVATVHGGGWRADYRDFQRDLPRSVRIVSGDRKKFDLRLALSQVDVNTPLGAEVFRVEIPRDAQPITLNELRDARPGVRQD